MIGRLDLVALLVRDVKASRHFYSEIVGMDVVKDSDGYVELRNEAVRLALYPRRALSELLGFAEPSGAAVSLSFVVDGVDEAFADLVKRGAKPLRAPTEMPWGQYVAFFVDPDGYLVEIVESEKRLGTFGR